MAKNNPEITINKFAEFLGATDSRKVSILKAVKSSSVEDFTKRIRYAVPKNALKAFMLDSKHEMKIFEQKSAALLNAKPASDFKKNDVKNSLLAIKSLEYSAQTLLPPYFILSSQNGLPKEKRQKKVNGVVIHYTPDVVFASKGDGSITGALKLVFSKGRAITPFEGQVIAGSIRQHIEKTFKCNVNPKNCFVLDVFAKKLYSSPSDFNYHRMRIKKGLSEVNELWQKIA